MENTGEGHQILNNCAIDATTMQDLLDHLDVHGLMSLVASRKFAPYVSCVLREIDKGITEVDTLIAPADADDSSETQDRTAPAPDGTTESPAAMRVRLQTGRRITRYRQGRS